MNNCNIIGAMYRLGCVNLRLCDILKAVKDLTQYERGVLNLN